jgi:hypothetical protein
VSLWEVIAVIKKKVIILVAADGNDYQDLVRSVRETWGSSKLEGFEILYYYGYREEPDPKPGECVQQNDILFCGADWRDPLTRNEIVLNYIYNNYDFEYLFKCCAGCYVVQKNMLKFLQDKPKTNFYCGRIGKCGKIAYASGSGFFLSKDLVKLLIDNPYGFRCQWCDDLGFGTFFAKKGIQVSDAPRQDFINDVIKDLDMSIYHYHFRHSIAIMHELHRRFVLEAEPGA